MTVARRLACVVREVIAHGERVYSVVLEPSLPAPRFQPGQFLHLALDQPDGGGFWPESRVFSIASSPDERDRLQITYAVKGPFTARMEAELAVGGRAWVKLPFGDFVIDPDADVVLFAGGTGFTAFAAYLRSVPADHGRRVLVYYGARNPDLFVYRDVVEESTRRTQAVAATFVTETTDGRLSVERAWPAILSLSQPVFYLSGPPAMLNALTEQLRERQVATEDIRTDAWE